MGWREGTEARPTMVDGQGGQEASQRGPPRGLPHTLGLSWLLHWLGQQHVTHVTHVTLCVSEPGMLSHGPTCHMKQPGPAHRMRATPSRGPQRTASHALEEPPVWPHVQPGHSPGEVQSKLRPEGSRFVVSHAAGCVSRDGCDSTSVPSASRHVIATSL